MRLLTMTWLRLPCPLTSRCLLSYCHGNQAMGKPWSRGVSRRASTMTCRALPTCPLGSRLGSPLAMLPLKLQPCRALSSARPGWYESVADSAPVHLTEQLLVSAQQLTGLPWWASILCTTLALRTTITLPLAVYQTLIIAKVEALQKEIAEIAKQLSYEISVRAKEKHWSEKTCRYHFRKNLQRVVSELYIRDNCHPFKTSLLIWVQLPMWVCVSLALRNLSVGVEHIPGGNPSLPPQHQKRLRTGSHSLATFLPSAGQDMLAPGGLLEQLAAGGTLWFPDLTLPDSTWVIPVSLGLVNLLITEIFALRQLESSKFQKYMTNFIRAISVVMVPLAATVPSKDTLAPEPRGTGAGTVMRLSMFWTLVFGVTLPFAAAAGRVPRTCGTCDASSCAPLPADGCASGTVPDACGCCSVCAAGAGEPCGGRGSAAQRCAPGLECVKGKKSKRGVCSCKSDYEVCGSDGVTYKTGCDLKAASLRAESERKPAIQVQNKGKCMQAPVIVTAPKEVWNVTGSQVYLGCEVIGIPTPVLTWRKVSGDEPTTLFLPGDRDNMAIQTRGGPEKHEVTGWVLISPLTKGEAGLYECHASNSLGEASAVGAIHVVDSISDIPSKKVVKEDEL
ncbi:hypothetical protein P4O66_007321 [Electrophorus voltai]|uniref:Insulin-like growth factor binding protein 7 n=1 Tax=Electrophorus voltai TaxID=2609070 RepID=A0AAD8ZK81_9TELE|nr:hypothetical protein P4O66_007321 [Electrophorus voltai]